MTLKQLNLVSFLTERNLSGNKKLVGPEIPMGLSYLQNIILFTEDSKSQPATCRTPAVEN